MTGNDCQSPTRGTYITFDYQTTCTHLGHIVLIISHSHQGRFFVIQSSSFRTKYQWIRNNSVWRRFCQLLPVVIHASRTAIVEITVRMVTGRSPVWFHFNIPKMARNMRVNDDPVLIEWLLKLSNGDLDG